MELKKDSRRPTLIGFGIVNPIRLVTKTNLYGFVILDRIMHRVESVVLMNS